MWIYQKKSLSKGKFLYVLIEPKKHVIIFVYINSWNTLAFYKQNKQNA